MALIVFDGEVLIASVVHTAFVSGAGIGTSARTARFESMAVASHRADESQRCDRERHCAAEIIARFPGCKNGSASRRKD